ncbi:MAG: hypothetical protein KF784_00045 [Fimbriimonadaceae bacterium]|nr:hypothetical protein [Fimbriimonadaceae bacterium]
MFSMIFSLGFYAWPSYGNVNWKQGRFPHGDVVGGGEESPGETKVPGVPVVQQAEHEEQTGAPAG